MAAITKNAKQRYETAFGLTQVNGNYGYDETKKAPIAVGLTRKLLGI